MKFSYLSLFFLSLFVSAHLNAQDASNAIQKIAFGSCIHQDHEQPIWQAVNQEQVDLFVFLGDNIYGDTRDMRVLKEKYQRLGANPGFQQLRKNTKIVATWDDHDFGENDAGGDYPFKEESREIMLDFFEEPQGTERRTRDSGIYQAYYFGEGEQRVQLLLLDLRWNRTQPQEQAWYEFVFRFFDSRGPYLPTVSPGSTILGETQWQWLEAELSKPATVRIVGSSLPILAESTGWEAWATFPKERDRLFELFRKTKANGLFLISGDTHWAEFSRVMMKASSPSESLNPLWELTSSGLTEEWSLVSPNPHRVGEYFNQANYGLIEFDWSAPSPQIVLSIKDAKGKLQLQQKLIANQLVF